MSPLINKWYILRGAAAHGSNKEELILKMLSMWTSKECSNTLTNNSDRGWVGQKFQVRYMRSRGGRVAFAFGQTQRCVHHIKNHNWLINTYLYLFYEWKIFIFEFFHFIFWSGFEVFKKLTAPIFLNDQKDLHTFECWGEINIFNY